MNEKIIKITVGPSKKAPVADLLCEASTLSKTKIKDAMTKGAVWLKKNKKRRRIRRASFIPGHGTMIELYYNPAILGLTAEKGSCIKDETHYSVWFKPSGLMSQGTYYGDHASILRQAELHFQNKRRVFPVNRLDREAAGLILLAHNKRAAAALSNLFKKRHITKTYAALVKGLCGSKDQMTEIAIPLDGKTAVTRFKLTRYEPEQDVSLLEVKIDTGRFHQIRRHLDMIGHPVMGDPKYGKGNKNKDGLKLLANALAFTCPVTHTPKTYHMDVSSFFSEDITSPLKASKD